MSRQSAYALRARLRGKPFDIAWARAFATHFDALAEAMLDRAINGIEVPHYYNGKLLGTSRKYDERLAMALLFGRGRLVRGRAPDWLPASAFEPDEVGALIDRVETGPEDWHREAQDELDARFPDAFPDEDRGVGIVVRR